MDARIFIPRFDAAPSPDKGPQDKGINEEVKGAVAADFDNSKWQVAEAPRGMGSYGINLAALALLPATKKSYNSNRQKSGGNRLTCNHPIIV
ncbi:MAG TPA: hypothetical protein VF681_10355 [Abditibacteriaceae bacterium]|jgi:hypothetical protein